MSHPSSAKSLIELRSLSDDELIRQHDLLASTTGVGIDYLGELERREREKQNRLLVRLTWIITALTGVNVIAVIASLMH